MKDYSNIIENLHDRVGESKQIHPENKKKMREFDNLNKANNKKGTTRYNYLIILKQLAEFKQVNDEKPKENTDLTKKTFQDMTKEDITGFVTAMDGKYSGKSTSAFRVNIKAFYKWLEGGDEEYPKKVSWIKNKGKPKDILPDQLITVKDTQDMIKAADTPRDRLIISLLAELGLRAGELASIRIRDCIFMDDYALVSVTGKTGRRQLRVYDSEPYLKMVYSMHPQLDEDPKKNRQSNEPLLINLNKSKHGQPLGYQGIYGVVKRLAKAAGLETHPHIFRHSALTRWGRHMKDAELRKFAGWSAGSLQTRTYIHLVDKDIQERQGQIQGDEPIEQQNGSKDFLPRLKCWKCNNKNPAGSLHCGVCGSILDKEQRDKAEAERMAQEVKRDKEIEAMKEALRQTQEYQRIMAEELKKLGLRKK